MKLVAYYKESNKMQFAGYINIEHIVKMGTSYKPLNSNNIYYEVTLDIGKYTYIQESDYKKIIDEYLMK